MNSTYIKYTAIAFLVASTGLAQAQQADKNIIEQEQEAALLQWNKSSNAAGLLLDAPTQNSKLEAGYRSAEGNFKQPQIGQEINDIFLNTQGNLYLKNYYLQGHFSYTRNDEKNAEYNASLIDPLRNIPYIVADTNASNWVKQRYDLGFKLTTKPIAERWSLGLGANYKAYSGAKQRDIRAANNYYELQLDPSVVYSINQVHHVGANFNYKNFKEESTNSNVNTYVDQGYFFLFGLGNNINYVGSGRTMDYQGDALGGGLQYQYNGNFKLFAEANYTIQAEDANIGFTNARPVGTILAKKWDAHLNFQKVSTRFTHVAAADFSSSNSNGIEYITQFQSGLDSDGYYVLYKSTRSKYKNTNVAAHYQLIRNQGNAYNWKASIFASYADMENQYIIQPALMQAENMTYGLSFDKLFQLAEAKNNQLSIGAKVAYKQNLNGTYNYTGADANSLTVTDLETRNFQYYTADYTNIQVPITYAQKLKQHSDTQVFIRATGQLITTNSFNFDNRKAFSLSIGASF